MEFCWALAITCIKLSILIFYVKIFSVPTFVLAARLAAGLVIAWCIGKSPPPECHNFDDDVLIATIQVFV